MDLQDTKQWRCLTFTLAEWKIATTGFLQCFLNGLWCIIIQEEVCDWLAIWQTTIEKQS